MAKTETMAGRGPPRRLLAATDLSSRSDRALRRAALLARARGTHLVVLHAVDDDQPRSLVEAEKREAAVLLRRQVAGLPEFQGLSAEVQVAEGDPFEAVLQAAAAQAADLVVVGEHRRRPLRDVFAGTTVERVIRHGDRPVLMVNQPPTGPFARVIAAVDPATPGAEQAVAAARRLGLLDGAELTLLHAFVPPGRGAMAMAGMPEAELDEHAAEAGREAHAALARFALRLELPRAPGLLVEEGRAASVIVGVAARLRPDLVVLGTRGLGAVRRALLGSVAAEVLSGLGCDALAVPPGAEQAA